MRSAGYLFLEGLKNLWKNRTMTIASIAVLISCLLLTGIAILLSLNMESTMQDIEGENLITIYLDDETPKIESVKIGDQIRNLPNISECKYVPNDVALNDIMLNLGSDGSLFDSMGGFLPDAFTISLIDLNLYQETMDEIQAMPYVDKYTDYGDIADKLLELETLIRYGCIFIIGLLALVSLFIISNTVKVTMFTRRVEIKIMKSVGATNLFVRIPFFVEGMLIGLISGAISATGLYFAYDEIIGLVCNISPSIQLIDLKPYTLQLFLVYAGTGALFGILGGLLTIGRYLKREGEKAIL